MAANEAQDQNVLIDKIIETPKGNLRIVLDYRTVREDVDNYYDKLRSSRHIPFDLSNIQPLDPIIIEASAKYPDFTPQQVIEATRQHYEVLSRGVTMLAWVIAITKKTPNFKFEPEPYPEPEPPEDDWDVHLSEPIPNLLNPVERRLKQIQDAIESTGTPMIMIELQNTMSEFGIQLERRVREIDADGFRSGRTGGTVYQKAQPDRVVKATRQPRARVAGVLGSNGNPSDEEGRSTGSGDGGQVSGTDLGEDLPQI